jgi:hypothetical protein
MGCGPVRVVCCQHCHALRLELLRPWISMATVWLLLCAVFLEVLRLVSRSHLLPRPTAKMVWGDRCLGVLVNAGLPDK